MKILICHNQYQHVGGEDTVVNAEYELLLKHGHDVKLYLINNDSIVGIFEKIKTGLHVNYSTTAKQNLTIALKEFHPDIVHFHNIFPKLTPSAYDACHELNIPVVQTLHNYRNICPAALLMRDGKVCEKCINHSTMNAVRYRCYRESTLQSLAVARMVSYHKKHKTWHTGVDQFIALTQFAKSKFEEAGFPPEKISVKPNFITPTPAIDQRSIKKKDHQRFVLFVGRLSKEKGLYTLIEAFKDLDIPLKIAGDGPLMVELNTNTQDNIEFLGSLPQPDIQQLMQDAEFLIMPSLWYEGFPMVIVEAFSNALPVLCSKLGGMAEIIKHDSNGQHFEAGNVDSLRKSVYELFNNPKKCHDMGINSKNEFNTLYSPDINYQCLLNIYQKTIKNAPY